MYAQHLEQKVAEIGGVQHLQPRLIGGIKFAALAIGEGMGLAGRHLVGRQPAVFPAVDMAGELARRPAFLVDAFGDDDLFHQAGLVVCVENREIGAQTGEFGMASQHLGTQRMEGAEPLHAFDGAADQRADPMLHLARGLVGEGHGENLVRPGLAGGQQMRQPRRQHPRLAGAGTRQNQNRPFQRFHRLALFGVQPFEIGRAHGRHRCRAGGARSRFFGDRAEVEGIVGWGHDSGIVAG